MKMRTVRLWLEILKRLDTVIIEVKYFFGRYWTGLTGLHCFAIFYKGVRIEGQARYLLKYWRVPIKSTGISSDKNPSKTNLSMATFEDLNGSGEHFSFSFS